MSYNILGINPFHNGSVCVLSDGEIVYFLEEERLSRLKHDANPFRVILDVLNKFKIDEIIIAGINSNDRYLSYFNEDPFHSLIRKFYPSIPFGKVSHKHHLTHIYHSFYNSGFEESLGIVIDGGGSSDGDEGEEVDSVYLCSFPNIKLVSTNYANYNKDIKVPLNSASSYSSINSHLGFKRNEEGKTMGLSSYGKFNNIFPSFFTKNLLSNTQFLYGKGLMTSKSYVFTLTPPKTTPTSTFTQEEKDLAWKIQNDTQQLVGDLIEKYLKETEQKHVCCAGGYFLNCVANYYLIKRFPDVKFYFEPISSDAGTAFGAAQLAWKQKTPDITKLSPQKTLYYGPKYSKKELLEGIKKYI